MFCATLAVCVCALCCLRFSPRLPAYPHVCVSVHGCNSQPCVPENPAVQSHNYSAFTTTTTTSLSLHSPVLFGCAATWLAAFSSTSLLGPRYQRYITTSASVSCQPSLQLLKLCVVITFASLCLFCCCAVCLCECAEADFERRSRVRFSLSSSTSVVVCAFNLPRRIQ